MRIEACNRRKPDKRQADAAPTNAIKGDRKGAIYGTIFTVLLASIFTFFQGVEYSVSSFTISDGVFGTCFFFGTGFHGFHVIVGTIFLAVGL